MKIDKAKFYREIWKAICPYKNGGSCQKCAVECQNANYLYRKIQRLLRESEVGK